MASSLTNSARLVALIGFWTPTFTELGIVSAMWNEHCSYKSSRLHLRKLPTKGPHIVYGPGENAGVTTRRWRCLRPQDGEPQPSLLH
jgi:phosphoribosylformylglycinamidine synthase